MLKCEHCRVTLRGEARTCPLCQGSVSGTADSSGSVFPTPDNYAVKTGRKLLVWIAFLSVCAGVVCVTVNLILPTTGWWSLFVLAGLVSFWADFGIMVKKHRNLPKNIMWQVAIITIIAFIWDKFTGSRGWSLDFVLPVLCTCAMVSMFVLAKIRRLEIQDYILYLVIVCILGLISLVLILANIVNIVMPTAICFGSSIICLASLIFFEGRALLAEIQRRLHL